MWRRDPSTAPKPPEESGRRLATFERANGTEQVRLCLASYEGHPFISVRVWARDDRGQWWPTKSGTSIRMGEIGEWVQALVHAEQLVAQPRKDRPADEPLEPEDRPRYVERRRRPEPRDVDREQLPRPATSTRPFSEFE